MSNPFSWEKRYKRTWEDLSDSSDTETETKKIIPQNSYKKGIIRHFHIIIDCSQAIEYNDFLPSFRFHICNELKSFVQNFYTENPISILSLLIYRNNKCEKYSILERNTNIDDFFTECGTGQFSLQDSIKMSLNFLTNDYIKEILVITPSLYSIGTSTLAQLENIKIHFLSLRGDVFLFQTIATKTFGHFFVPIESKDISFYLKQFCTPSTINNTIAVNLLKLGFPSVTNEYLACACCLKPSKYGYLCPICNTMICKLPCLCPICKTQLVMNSSLVQSLYYCYPLDQFNKIVEISKNAKSCRVCSDSGKNTCPKCESVYCHTCTEFVHTDLSFCFFCE